MLGVKCINVQLEGRFIDDFVKGVCLQGECVCLGMQGLELNHHYFTTYADRELNEAANVYTSERCLGMQGLRLNNYYSIIYAVREVDGAAMYTRRDE